VNSKAVLVEEAERVPSGLVKAAVVEAVRSARPLEPEATAHGLSVDAYEQLASAHLTRLVETCELSMRIWPDALEDVLAAGTFDPEAGVCSDVRLGLVKPGDGVLECRKATERELFGSHPSYGYLSSPLEILLGEGGAVSLDRYGPLKLVLSENLRPRTTLILGDLAYNHEIGNSFPQPLTQLSPYCVIQGRSPFTETVDPAPCGYAEIQIHGHFTLEDIVRVDTGAPLPTVLLETLTRLGIEIRDLQLPDGWRRLLAALLATSPAMATAIHGARHWVAVARNAVELAERTEGASAYVGVLFALLHDCARESDGDDPEHGARAAGRFIELERLLPHPLPEEDVDRLMWALIHHDQGVTSTDPTIGVCFDADRLELARVGITPDPRLLSTKAGRQRIGVPREPVPLATILQTLRCGYMVTMRYSS
jgi:uncharacterized protein